MALFYTLTFRGTIAAQNWAVSTHWRATSVDVGTSEADICSALCDAGQGFWDDYVKIQLTTRTNLTKLIAVAFDEPTGFYELSSPTAGTLNGDINPPFVSKGFRQFRSNQVFRTSTHRFPEVREANNVDGSWVYDTDVAAGNIAHISDFLGNVQHGTVIGGIAVIDFTPVLLRKQYTVVDPITHAKTTTYINPPEISDVQSAAFYGITSQVSRKYVLPT